MKRIEKVGSPYYPSKVPRLVENGGLDYLFTKWKIPVTSLTTPLNSEDRYLLKGMRKEEHLILTIS
jgi:hypothetical protein